MSTLWNIAPEQLGIKPRTPRRRIGVIASFFTGVLVGVSLSYVSQPPPATAAPVATIAPETSFTTGALSDLWDVDCYLSYLICCLSHPFDPLFCDGLLDSCLAANPYRGPSPEPQAIVPVPMPPRSIGELASD